MLQRGFHFFSTTEDPRIHDRYPNSQKSVLALLLHPFTMQHISDARLHGNEYPLAEVMADLTDALFAADAEGDVHSFRQNVQVEYVNRLAAIVEDEDDQ